MANFCHTFDLIIIMFEVRHVSVFFGRYFNKQITKFLRRLLLPQDSVTQNGNYCQIIIHAQTTANYSISNFENFNAQDFLNDVKTTKNRNSHQSCSIKKVFLEISQKLQAYNFIKNETLAQMFSCKFCERTLQFPAELVTFTEKIPHGKLQVLFSVTTAISFSLL